MTIDHKRILHYINELLKADQIEDGSFNGLQVEGTRAVKKIATAVTASLYVIEQAIKLNADALIVHHGLFYGPVVHVQGTMRKKLAALLDSGMHLFAYHLPLDASREVGNAWPIAKKLGCKKVESFLEFGIIGEISPQPVEDIQKALSKIWKAPGQLVKPSDRKVKKLALVTGSGHKFFGKAIAAGVDCFITGTADEPQWHMAREENVHFLSYGHAATEKTGVQLLGKHLSKKFGLKEFFIDESNPF